MPELQGVSKRRNPTVGRRENMPITRALYNRRQDNASPEERLAEHKASVVPKERTSLVRGQLVGKLGPRGFGNFMDSVSRMTAEKPKRRRRPRRKKPVAA